MGLVRRTITSISVWLAVTAVAVALSWWGVRSVLRDTVFEPPRAPALAAEDDPPPATRSTPPTSAAPDLISATNRPSSAPPSSVKPPAGSSPPPTSKRESPSADAVQSFEVRGGRAAFRYRPQSAALLAATPNSGWSVKVWPSEKWIRVDFTGDGRTSSVFVVWNGHGPTGSTYEE
jgi:hypothetical protein